MIRAGLGVVVAVTLSLWSVVARAEIEITQVTSPGGIEAWLVEAPEMPFVTLEILFAGGASLDPAGQRGAGYLMSGLLEEGAGEMDARAFQAAREGLAASYGFDISDDTMSVSARFLTETGDAAIDLLHLALTEPRFDADAMERVRAQVQAIIARDAVNPGNIARREFYAAAFPDHPYGSGYEGTPDSVAALTRDDLIAAHRRTLVRDRIHVGAVGDISPEALGLMLDRLLGDLPLSQDDLPGPAEYALTGGVRVVDFPGPQSIAFFGHRGMARDDEDFFAAFVLNQILGAGGFESRLMDEVREKRGLTYGIGTFLSTRANADMLLGSVSSANDTMAEAIAVIREVWADMAENGVTEAELAAAKTYLTGEYPLRFDSNASIARIIVGMQYVGLTPDYITDRNAMVEAVTLADVNRVAAELLDPQALQFTVVGQPAGLDATQ